MEFSPFLIKSTNQHLSTLLFADDQVIILNTENNSRKAECKLNQIRTERGSTLSVEKTKLIAFKIRGPIRSEICNR